MRLWLAWRLLRSSRSRRALQAAARAENHFGAIYIDGKKAGQVHYTVEYGEDGEVETLKTRASLSILGIKLFNFEQNLHEAWQQRRRCSPSRAAPTTTARSTRRR